MDDYGRNSGENKGFSRASKYAMLRHLFFAVLLIALIFIEATQPPTIGNGIIPHLDKLAHFCVFGFLAFLLIKVLRPSGIAILWRDVFIVCMMIFVVTVGDELVQSFNTARDASIGDIVAGCLGAFSVTSVIKVRRKPVK